MKTLAIQSIKANGNATPVVVEVPDGYEDSYYSAYGNVIGLTWDFTEGAYAAKRYTARTREELMQQINEDFKSGALDGGFGFQKLIGAEMQIVKSCLLRINGLQYEAEDDEIVEIGHIPEWYRDQVEGQMI